MEWRGHFIIWAKSRSFERNITWAGSNVFSIEGSFWSFVDRNLPKNLVHSRVFGLRYGRWSQICALFSSTFSQELNYLYDRKSYNWGIEQLERVENAQYILDIVAFPLSQIRIEWLFGKRKHDEVRPYYSILGNTAKYEQRETDVEQFMEFHSQVVFGWKYFQKIGTHLIEVNE